MTDSKRPPMKKAMAEVMGDQVMGASEVTAALEARGWLPNTSVPEHYVAYMLSSNKDAFERVERGRYRSRAYPKAAMVPTPSPAKEAYTIENVPVWLRPLVEFVERVDAPLVWRGYVDKGGPEGSVPCTAEELAISHPASDWSWGRTWVWVVDASPEAGATSYDVGHLLTGFDEPPKVHGSLETLEVRGKYRGISVVLVFWYEEDGDLSIPTIEAEGEPAN